MPKNEWLGKFSGIFYALLIATGVTVLSFFEAFTLLDEWAYDVFERVTLNPQTRTSVLLVEAAPETQMQGDQTWLTLLTILEEKNAKQVVFTFMPKGVSSQFYCQAHKYGNVFFARSIQHNAQGGQQLEPLPDLPTHCEIKFGVVDIPPHTHGIHRQQQMTFQIEEQSYPALEIVAAKHFFQTNLSFLNNLDSQPDTQYRVHFSKGLDEFPKLKLARIIAGGLVSELVKERSVIIGITRPSQVPGLHTPLAMTHDVMISMPEYHALALNTLLNKEQIITFNVQVEWILLLILVLFNLFIYQRLTIHQTLRVTLIVMGIYVVLAWLLYHYALIWLPLVEMIVAQSLLYLFDFQYKSITSDRALRETLVESSFKIEDRVNSESFALAEYWAQIVVMSHDILDLTRLIILECLPNHPEVKEVKALHCSLTDIDKRQRHYKSKLYITAVNNKGAFQLTQALLKPTEVAEEQYLVPLFFGSEVQGFWILAIEKVKRLNNNRFEEGVKDLAIQMGESLYHRQQWLLRHRANQNLLNRYFYFASGELLHQALSKSVAALEHRLSVLENIMDDLETPTIFYDVFGTPIKVNKSMKVLSQIFGLTPQSMSALGFLMEISQMDIETARQHFRRILLEQDKIGQQVKLSASIERVYFLHTQLFFYQEQIDGTEQLIKQGILCQLVDVTQMKLQSTLKEQVAERLIFQFRNDMQSILTASKLLTNDNVSGVEKRMVGDMLEGKMNNHLKILNEVEEQLRSEIDATVEVYPIESKAPVLEAMENLAEAATKRPVKWQPELPALVSLVYAAPNKLTPVIASLLTLLIEDAMENTQITIAMEERDHWLTYTFKNTGFGIPNERLQQYLFDSEVAVSESFDNIRQALEFVKIWQGTLTAESQVGQGIFFELRLKSFI